MFRDGFVRSQCMMPMSRCQRHDVAEGDSCAVLVHRAHALWSYKVLAITYLTFAIYSTEIKIQGLCCVNRSIYDILDWVIKSICHTGYGISVQYLNSPLCYLSLTTLSQRVHVYIYIYVQQRVEKRFWTGLSSINTPVPRDHDKYGKPDLMPTIVQTLIDM